MTTRRWVGAGLWVLTAVQLVQGALALAVVLPALLLLPTRRLALTCGGSAS